MARVVVVEETIDLATSGKKLVNWQHPPGKIRLTVDDDSIPFLCNLFDPLTVSQPADIGEISCVEVMSL
jgi:hypothetical protein